MRLSPLSVPFAAAPGWATPGVLLESPLPVPSPSAGAPAVTPLLASSRSRSAARLCPRGSTPVPVSPRFSFPAPSAPRHPFALLWTRPPKPGPHLSLPLLLTCVSSRLLSCAFFHVSPSLRDSSVPFSSMALFSEIGRLRHLHSSPHPLP